MPPLVQFGSSVNIDVVSIHPRLFRRGNWRTGVYRWGLDSVSIHPRLFRRGNARGSQRPPEAASFNPPPPFQARELVRFFGHRVLHLFQSTPAFSGEGTDQRARFFLLMKSFNPPPPFQARELVLPCRLRRLGLFQSTPAFSGEGTEHQANRDQQNSSFNPPPPFQAREQR